MTETILQAPVVRPQPWMARALCADCDPDLWFPDPEDPPGIRIARTAEAIRICRRCPVRGQCLRWAFESNDSWGILGGLTKRMRSQLRNRLKRKRELGR